MELLFKRNDSDEVEEVDWFTPEICVWAYDSVWEPESSSSTAIKSRARANQSVVCLWGKVVTY